jgi:hypothetical protein
LGALGTLNAVAEPSFQKDQLAPPQHHAGQVFVGRHREMGTLQAVREEILPGYGQLVMLGASRALVKPA